MLVCLDCDIQCSCVFTSHKQSCGGGQTTLGIAEECPDYKWDSNVSCSEVS